MKTIFQLLVIVAMLMVAGGVSAYDSDEILGAGDTSLPDYIGAPAKAHPTANSGVPQNPFVAPNPFSHSHSDIWMSDTADIAGPLGRKPVIKTTTLPEVHDTSWLVPTGSMSFDKQYVNAVV